MSDYTESIGAYPPLGAANDVQVMPEQTSDDPTHILDRSCWCDPVIDGRYVHHRNVTNPPDPVEVGIHAGIAYAVELIDKSFGNIVDKPILTEKLTRILIESYRSGTLFEADPVSA